MNNQTVENYLNDLAVNLTLPQNEKDKIDASIKVIKDKLVLAFFDYGLKEVKPIGSYDRGTLLSRKVDTESDVDILIVFDEKKWESQTYLNKLKQFANDEYPRADNYQDHPTIVIELNHIKFELIPCVFKAKTFFDDPKYLIPKRVNSEIEWIETFPNYLKNKIGEFEETGVALLKLIHLFKNHNFKNQDIYKTYVLEKFIIKNFDFENSLASNCFRIIRRINYIDGIDHKENVKLKKHKFNIELLLEHDMEEYAMMELKKMFPHL